MASVGGTVCQCGCAELDTDPAGGHVVCTRCGTVLETSLIVSEVQFEESAGGSSAALGQFVGADGKVGKTFAGFYGGLKKESRELTLRNARRKISQLCAKLQLNQHCQDTAFNFFKMALHRRLTAGRKNDLVVAACIYIMCRTEGTAHMLIDFSDTLKVGVYELGRTFLKLSTELHINIPAIDPCLYILRFAHKLDFGDKTHKVSMTALRIVQRMKRDWLHTGRRPSGLCGAALLLAARLHEFNRTVVDIVKVVKVHHSTVRKRLLEFGETPTSALTLDEFMNVDLEEERDPPSFIAARKKDKDDSQGTQVSNEEFQELQCQIEKLLADKKKRSSHWENYVSDLERSGEEENKDIMEFIHGQTTESITSLISDELGSKVAATTDPVAVAVVADGTQRLPAPGGLGPSLKMLGLMPAKDSGKPGFESVEEENEDDGTLDLTGIDDGEIDTYLLSNEESRIKSLLWAKLNAEYLREQQAKAKFRAENPTPDKPKRKFKKRKLKQINAHTPGEAIEKMLQEKKISTKINYDVLRNLKAMAGPLWGSEGDQAPEETDALAEEIKPLVEPEVEDVGVEGDDDVKPDVGVFARPTGRAPRKRAAKSEKEGPKRARKDAKSVESTSAVDQNAVAADTPAGSVPEETLNPLGSTDVAVEEAPTPEFKHEVDHDDLEFEHDEVEEEDGHVSAAQLLQQHRAAMGDDYDEDEYF